MADADAKRYLAVKNFERFQHYGDRRPTWIKLYTALLDDWDFLQLPDAVRGQLMLFWLLAATHNNRIRNDANYIRGKLSAKKLYLKELLGDGWLYLTDEAPVAQPVRRRSKAASPVASDGLAQAEQRASVEEEKEEEGEEKRGDTPPACDAGLAVHFAEPRHRDAYAGHRRVAQNPINLDHEIRLLAEGGERPSKGRQPAVGWEVVGEALHHLSVTGGRPTPRALQSFCETVLLGNVPALRTGSDRPVSVLQERAEQVWRRYSAAGLVREGLPRQELERIGHQFVADGIYPDYATFLAEYIAVEPAQLAGARTHHWAVEQIVERLSGIRLVSGSQRSVA